MIRIKKTGEFDRLYETLIQNDPSCAPLAEEAIGWFQDNPEDTRIRNHSLHRGMEGKWAFSVTDDIRVVYEWIGKHTIRLLAIGGHPKVYNRKRQRE